MAAYLSVSVPQVDSLVRAGDLPAIKIGGRGVWRVDRKKLDDDLDRLEEETAAWPRPTPLTRRTKRPRRRAGGRAPSLAGASDGEELTGAGR